MKGSVEARHLAHITAMSLAYNSAVITPQISERQRVVRWVRTMPVVFLLFGLSFGSWLSRLPSVRDATDASTLEMSFYGICLASGSVAGLILSGRIVQQVGPKRTLCITTLLQAFALLSAAWVLLDVSVPGGLVLLFIFGFMFAVGDVAMNVSGAEAERAFGKPRMPLMHAGYSTGTVVAMALGATAEAFNVPVQLHLAVVCAILVVAVLCLLPGLPADKIASQSAPVTESTGAITVISSSSGHQPAYSTATGPISIVTPAATEYVPIAPAATMPDRRTRAYSAWRNPRVLIIGVIALSAGIVDGTASDWLPLALVDGRGLENSTGTLMLGVFLAAIMVSRLVGSAILGRFGRVNTLRGSAALGTIGLILVLTMATTPAFITGVVLWGLGSGLAWPIAISAAADRPETAVRDVAAVSALGYGSMLLGPMAFGILGEWIGLLNTFWLLLIFTLIIAVFSRTAKEPESPARITSKLSQ